MRTSSPARRGIRVPREWPMLTNGDARAETYVPGLKDPKSGCTPLKALLLMAPGGASSEDYASRPSDIHKLARLTLEAPTGSLAAVKQFTTRRSPPGARFSYASA